MARLKAQLEETVEQVVPWFLEQMPRPYFQDTDESTRLAHLMALVAARASSVAPRLTIESRSGDEITFIEGQDRPGLLAELVHQLPDDRQLTSAKVHTAADDSVVLDVFRFGDRARFDPADSALADKLLATQAYAIQQGDETATNGLAEGFGAASAEYVRTVPPLRLYENHRLWAKVRGTEDTAVRRSDQADPGLVRINVATGNADSRSLFERVVALLGQREVDIARAFMDAFVDDRGHTVTVLGFVVSAATCPTGAAWVGLRGDLSRLRWLDDRALQLHRDRADLPLQDAEILVALCDLAHARLAREDPFAYSRDRLLERLNRHLSVTRKVATFFSDRFDPDRSVSDEVFEGHLSGLIAQVEREVDSEHDRRFIGCLIEAVQATLRTNYFVPTRYGLALRIDPSFFARPDRAVDPFGIFFVHGRGFDGFHVRFADIARGGVRVVRPRGLEQHELEAERVFEEAYDLAFAQQLKNKDIPEGGSKAVILAEPAAPIELSVKAFADGLLDLLTPDPEVRARVIDRFGAPELLYLGPDENISADLIEWVVERARARGYPLADAFMSSKPGAGINHKEFGVTSEGVTVFLEEALRSVGIDPRKQAFTVKLTGGPDGDVAGNEIRILYREFGDHAKVVGVADGSGSARDPDGLDPAELMRLVQEEAPIAAFAPARLGPRGQVLSLDAPDGLRARNNLCFEVEADAFIPAGGRPQTIHAGNWRRFLNEAGEPSSRVIVEGANLFITPEARAALSREARVVIVKDSSANKCGVICSSFEITASMMLSPAEFLQVKPVFVSQVLDRLRLLARREAQLLFREHAKNPDVLLPDLSVTVSRTILRATEAIRDALDGLEPSRRAELDRLVVEHLPAVLADDYLDRIPRLPERYRAHIVASSLATRLVYREGIDFLAHLPRAQIAPLAFEYLDRGREAERLADEVAESGLPNRDRVAALLRAGGARAGLT